MVKVYLKLCVRLVNKTGGSMLFWGERGYGGVGDAH
jgi:hypothetical protein